MSDGYARIAFGEEIAKWAMQDLNLRPPACRAEGRSSQVPFNVELTTRMPLACTVACDETAHYPKTDPLADIVASLSTDQRERLAAMLIGKDDEGASRPKIGTESTKGSET